MTQGMSIMQFCGRSDTPEWASHTLLTWGSTARGNHALRERVVTATCEKGDRPPGADTV
jgi:hypothetical protein